MLHRITISNIGGDKSFADDLNKERGIVSVRVVFVPRSAEIKPLFRRFVHWVTHIQYVPYNVFSSSPHIPSNHTTRYTRLRVCLYTCLRTYTTTFLLVAHAHPAAKKRQGRREHAGASALAKSERASSASEAGSISLLIPLVDFEISLLVVK